MRGLSKNLAGLGFFCGTLHFLVNSRPKSRLIKGQLLRSCHSFIRIFPPNLKFANFSHYSLALILWLLYRASAASWDHFGPHFQVQNLTKYQLRHQVAFPEFMVPKSALSTFLCLMSLKATTYFACPFWIFLIVFIIKVLIFPQLKN